MSRDERDEEFTELLNSFMDRLRRYLDEGGPDSVIDRILAAGSLAAAAATILWAPNRKLAGLIGLILSAVRQRPREPRDEPPK